MGKVIDIVLITLIAANVMAVLFETLDGLYRPYAHLFALFEVFSVAVFSVEYAVRVWISSERAEYSGAIWPRLRYMLSPMALIDLFAILPFYLSFLVAFDLRFLRVLRLLRVLKLTRYSSAMTMLLDVIREEASTFFAAFFLLLVLLILAASGAYIVEHDAQPDKFASIPHAMWWAIITLTSVGYGDVSPITPAGQFFGSVVSVIGVGVAALPAGILASGLADQVRRKREEMRRMLLEALKDGVIDAEEELELEAYRRRHGISVKILNEVKSQLSSESTVPRVFVCRHCGKEN
nr:potassium channel family protein [Ruegeria sp. HKCCD8929]